MSNLPRGRGRREWPKKQCNEQGNNTQSADKEQLTKTPCIVKPSFLSNPVPAATNSSSKHGAKSRGLIKLPASTLSSQWQVFTSQAIAKMGNSICTLWRNHFQWLLSFCHQLSFVQKECGNITSVFHKLIVEQKNYFRYTQHRKIENKTIVIMEQWYQILSKHNFHWIVNCRMFDRKVFINWLYTVVLCWEIWYLTLLNTTTYVQYKPTQQCYETILEEVWESRIL